MNSEQAQTVAEIRERDKESLLAVDVRAARIRGYARQDIRNLLQIIDSQAAEIDRLKSEAIGEA